MVTRNPHLDERRKREVYGGADPRERFIAESNRRRWSPRREFGQHGEFSGSRREEVLPSPNMPGSYRGGDEGWGNYPAGEFAGITSPDLLKHLDRGPDPGFTRKGFSYKDLMDEWLGREEETPYGGDLTKRGMFQDAKTMAKDLTGSLPPELSEGYEPILGNWMTRQNPYFGEKQWNPDDIGGQTWGVDYTSEQERPRWDNWLGNLLRSIGGRNRGGLASLRYAR